MAHPARKLEATPKPQPHETRNPLFSPAVRALIDDSLDRPQAYVRQHKVEGGAE